MPEPITPGNQLVEASPAQIFEAQRTLHARFDQALLTPGNESEVLGLYQHAKRFEKAVMIPNGLRPMVRQLAMKRAQYGDEASSSALLALSPDGMRLRAKASGYDLGELEDERTLPGVLASTPGLAQSDAADIVKYRTSSAEDLSDFNGFRGRILSTVTAGVVPQARAGFVSAANEAINSLGISTNSLVLDNDSDSGVDKETRESRETARRNVQVRRNEVARSVSALARYSVRGSAELAMSREGAPGDTPMVSAQAVTALVKTAHGKWFSEESSAGFGGFTEGVTTLALAKPKAFDALKLLVEAPDGTFTVSDPQQLLRAATEAVDHMDIGRLTAAEARGDALQGATLALVLRNGARRVPGIELTEETKTRLTALDAFATGQLDAAGMLVNAIDEQTGEVKRTDPATTFSILATIPATVRKTIYAQMGVTDRAKEAVFEGLADLAKGKTPDDLREYSGATSQETREWSILSYPQPATPGEPAEVVTATDALGAFGKFAQSLQAMRETYAEGSQAAQRIDTVLANLNSVQTQLANREQAKSNVGESRKTFDDVVNQGVAKYVNPIADPGLRDKERQKYTQKWQRAWDKSVKQPVPAERVPSPLFASSSAVPSFPPRSYYSAFPGGVEETIPASSLPLDRSVRRGLAAKNLKFKDLGFTAKDLVDAEQVGTIAIVPRLLEQGYLVPAIDTAGELRIMLNPSAAEIAEATDGTLLVPVGVSDMRIDNPQGFNAAIDSFLDMTGERDLKNWWDNVRRLTRGRLTKQMDDADMWAYGTQALSETASGGVAMDAIRDVLTRGAATGFEIEYSDLENLSATDRSRAARDASHLQKLQEAERRVRMYKRTRNKTVADSSRLLDALQKLGERELKLRESGTSIDGPVLNSIRENRARLTKALAVPATSDAELDALAGRIPAAVATAAAKGGGSVEDDAVPSIYE